MKKILQHVIAGIFLLGAVSCGEEFIDRYPLDRPNPATFFIDKVSARQTVNAAYQPWTRNADMFQRDAIIVWDAMTDDSHWRPSRGATIAQERWDISATHGAIDNYWEFAFQSINAANFAIQGIPGSSDPNFTEEEQLPFIAEARFMRGFAYLFLVTFFGDVPLITAPLSDFDEYHQPRVSRNKVFEQIISDFEFAKQYLPDEQPDAKGAAVRATAAAYLAKAYLYNEDWQNASVAAVDAIAIAQSTGFRLIDDYLSIWDHNNEGNPELLFYISYAHNSEEYGQNMSIQRISRILPAQLRYIYGAGDGWGYALPQRALYDAFEADDPRRGYTLFAPGDFFGVYNQSTPFTYTHEHYDDNGNIIKTPVTYNNGDAVIYDHRWSETGMNVRKMIMNMEGITNVRWAGQDVPLMRMADLYLIAAEAFARQGNVPEALNHVNAVRSRASVDLPDRALGDGRPGSGSILDIVKHERRVELAMEGVRLFDLLRWGEAKTVFGDGTAVKRHFYSDFLTDANVKFDNPTSYMAGIMDPVLLPIPQAELDANTMIDTNNPGWD